jgi:hypothetical protein
MFDGIILKTGNCIGKIEVKYRVLGFKDHCMHNTSFRVVGEWVIGSMGLLLLN